MLLLVFLDAPILFMCPRVRMSFLLVQSNVFFMDIADSKRDTSVILQSINISICLQTLPSLKRLHISYLLQISPALSFKCFLFHTLVQQCLMYRNQLLMKNLLMLLLAISKLCTHHLLPHISGEYRLLIQLYLKNHMNHVLLNHPLRPRNLLIQIPIGPLL